MGFSAKITSKGQVTIPKEIRKNFNSDVIEFIRTEQGIMIRSVESVEGILADYGKKIVPLKDVREKVWGSVARDKK